VVASLVAENRLQDVRASVVVAHGLSCSAACGILPGQRLNPCLHRWQVDSLPLSHQGSLLFRLDEADQVRHMGWLLES